ncbi:unnamed protein product [Cyprideis torosa]|uniref:Uncharacterized protein n=1 Tax=Cyprideis torosa TaxID=163714 RepID=A0A7R8WF91_9CRUS|nr:unnamed protein product [Cyprideis torosa]CAG0896544.1 unnamed protein product [Cyprideis torosa]
MYLFQWCTDNCLCLDIGPRRLGQLNGKNSTEEERCQVATKCSLEFGVHYYHLNKQDLGTVASVHFIPSRGPGENGEDDTLLFTMSASLPVLTITDDRWCVSIDDEYPNGRIVRGSVFRIAAEEFADDLPKQGHRIAVSRLTGSTSHCRWEGILQQGKIDWSSVVRFEDLVEEDDKYFVPLKLGIFKEYFNKDSFSIVISSGLYFTWDSNVYTPHTVVIDTSDVKFKEDVLLVQLPDPIACKAYAVTITNRHWVPGVRERWSSCQHLLGQIKRSKDLEIGLPHLKRRSRDM